MGTSAVVSRIGRGLPTAHRVVPEDVQGFPAVLAGASSLLHVHHREPQVELQEQPELLVPEVQAQRLRGISGEPGSGVGFSLTEGPHRVSLPHRQEELLSDLRGPETGPVLLLEALSLNCWGSYGSQTILAVGSGETREL